LVTTQTYFSGSKLAGWLPGASLWILLDEVIVFLKMHVSGTVEG